jgi:hypothetical protein
MHTIRVGKDIHFTYRPILAAAIWNSSHQTPESANCRKFAADSTIDCNPKQARF